MTDRHDDKLTEGMEALSQKLQLDVNVLRDITPDEIQYLLDMCPFLQIVDTVVQYVEEMPPEVQFVQARSGWTILDYGDAMSSSPGERILGMAEYHRKDEDDEGGQGTIWNQAFITATEMVEIAKSRGWHGIQIVDGHRIMKRAAWIKALAAGLSVSGFEPNKEDEKVRARVEMDADSYQTLRHRAMRSNR